MYRVHSMNRSIVLCGILGWLLASSFSAAQQVSSSPRETTPGLVESVSVGEAEQAEFCPGLGNCCEANSSPGCDDEACCALVCAIDAECCIFGWDSVCATKAIAECSPAACGGGSCPSTGDCCSAHDTPGCDTGSCCDLVCTQDPFCCDGEWDADCADLSRILCDDICSPLTACPGNGDCCLSSDTVACDDPDCCVAICVEDPFCCTGAWDSICGDLAGALCAPLCSGGCPGEGDCCSLHDTGGCNDRTCCGEVCAADASCCEGPWSANCVSLAASLCSNLCSASCPGEGDCCETNGTPGCSDATCCNLVCEQDGFCCFLPWDAGCRSYALELCGDLCTTTPVCPGTGSCCQESASPGCEDAACCERVCDANGNCCSGSWTAECVFLAGTLCGASCACPLFGDFDGNGRIDLRDAARFQACFSGDQAVSVPPECACGDLAGNADVDLIDFKAFQSSIEGP